MTTLAELGLSVSDLYRGQELWENWSAGDRRRLISAMDDELTRLRRKRQLIEDLLRIRSNVRDLLNEMVLDMGPGGAGEVIQRWREEAAAKGRASLENLDAVLIDAQRDRDDEWITVEQAAHVYGCSDSYVRRLARTRFVRDGHARQRHDGTWEVSCGAIRNLRRRS